MMQYFLYKITYFISESTKSTLYGYKNMIYILSIYTPEWYFYT